MQSTVLNNMGPGNVRERFFLDFSDLVGTAGLTKTINLKSLPAYTVVFGAVIIPKTAFAGTTTLTAKVGLAAGATDTIVDAGDVKAAVANTTLYTAGSNVSNLFPFISTKAADTLTITFTATVDNLTALTAGALWVDVFYWLAEDLSGCGPAGNNITGTGGLG